MALSVSAALGAFTPRERNLLLSAVAFKWADARFEPASQPSGAPSAEEWDELAEKIRRAI